MDGNGTLDINEFLTVFDQLFGLKGKVSIATPIEFL